MNDFWFAAVTAMFVAYVVLDGFDLGAGLVSFSVGRSNDERGLVRAAIGPYWDGNELWLVAAGGTMFAVFPRVLASGFSGFYLPIFFVVWTLIIRGISLELGGHGGGPLWRGFFDVAFAGSSGLLPLFLGIVLGNLLRGVPLDDAGWFELPLFASGQPGFLDGFTLAVGALACLALAMHGAAYLAAKVDGDVGVRAARLCRRLGIALAVAWPLVFFFAVRVQPRLASALAARPLAWAALAVAVAGLALAILASGWRAFLGSAAWLGGCLAGLAACLWPSLLVSTRGGDLTAANAASAPGSLRVAIGWLAVGLPLVVTWFSIIYRAGHNMGKVKPHG